MSHRPSTVAGRMVGTALRELRTKAGLDPTEVRHRTGIGQSTLSRAECGINVHTLGAELGTLLGCYGADRATRGPLLHLATRAHISGWCDTRPAGHSADHWEPLVQAETRATDILCWHPAAVPALAQTPAYARWILAAVDPDHLDSLIAARTHRQHAVLQARGDSAARLTVLVAPAALRIPDLGIRTNQYRHLIRLAGQDRITVRLTQAPPAEIGNFEIITGRDPMIHIDHPTLDLVVEEPDQLRRHHDLWRTLCEHALSDEETRHALARAIPGPTRAGGAGR